MKKSIKTTVTFDPEVMEYLDELARKAERDRSWVINALAREHRKRAQEGRQVELFDPARQLIAVE